MSRRMKVLILLITAVILTTTISFSFTTGNDDMLENLVGKRIDILNSFYNNEIDMFDAKKELEKVEDGYLLDEDLENMKKMSSFRYSDMEEIKKYRFLGTYIKQADEEVIIGKITLRWEIVGINGKEVIDITYNTICEDEGEGYRLVHLYGN